MFIVPIAWLYVAMMMAVAEATSTNGTVLGAIFTFLLYGLLPVGLVVYLMGTPARKRAIRAREDAGQPESAGASIDALTDPADPADPPPTAPTPPSPRSAEPDARGHAPAAPQTDAVAPVREKP
jgi:hypothetical protein